MKRHIAIWLVIVALQDCPKNERLLLYSAYCSSITYSTTMTMKSRHVSVTRGTKHWPVLRICTSSMMFVGVFISLLQCRGKDFYFYDTLVCLQTAYFRV